MDVKRFWANVSVTGAGCWEWQGYRDPEWGYGITRNKKAHRLAWELIHGAIPGGMCVCHACDNPPCINPGHLWLGTHKQNTHDRCAKGRSNTQRGERQGLSKLTAGAVKTIRAGVALGYSQRQLAAEYGVSPCTINDVIKGRTWIHV